MPQRTLSMRMLLAKFCCHDEMAEKRMMEKCPGLDKQDVRQNVE